MIKERVTLNEIVEIIQQRYPYPWAKDERVVFDWIVWYVKQGFAVCVSEDGWHVSGLLLVRPIMEAEDGRTHFIYDNEGSVIYVDFAYALNEENMRGLVTAAIVRFGRRNKVAWMRRERLRCYPASRFVLHTLKENHVPA